MSTPRANALRSLRRQGFEQVVFDCGGYCPSQLDAFEKRFGHREPARHFGVPFRGVGLPMEKTWTDAKAIFPREELPPDTDIDVYGIGHSKRPGCFHMTRMHHPLKGEVSLAEVQNYPLPRMAPGAQATAAAAAQAVHAQGFASVGYMHCTVWETAWYLRSMEELMMDMMGDDERATVHLDRVTAEAVLRMQAYARAGVDIVQLGDDIGMQSTIMMALPLWRQWLKPRLQAIIAAGKAIKPDLLVFYHSCGFVLPFLDDLIEIGVDILNPVQPECMPFAEVHARTAGRLSYWGTIGTQSVLPFGTPAEVKAVVHANLRACGPAGGIVICPTHMVEPEVPWANLQAMYDACVEWRG